MMRHQGLVQKDFHLPERLLNVRVYFLDLLVIFCTWGHVKGGSFLFILTQSWSLTWSCLKICKYLEGRGTERKSAKITGKCGRYCIYHTRVGLRGFGFICTFLLKFLLAN